MKRHKKICVIRHAKSSWDNPTMDDIDRPLNKRGLRDALNMPARLKEHLSRVDHCVSSPAVRTKMTSKFFMDAYKLLETDRTIDNSIYMCSLSTMFSTIDNLKEDWNTVMIFGHNPITTMFVNSFNDGFIDNVPTCGIAIIESNQSSWKNFTKKNSKLNMFIYPKMFA